jgi:hypothetical protein
MHDRTESSVVSTSSPARNIDSCAGNVLSFFVLFLDSGEAGLHTYSLAEDLSRKIRRKDKMGEDGFI